MKFSSLTAIVVATVALAGCGGEATIGDGTEPSIAAAKPLLLANPESQETSESSVEGQIGLQINARRLAALGYRPTTVEIEILGGSYNFLIDNIELGLHTNFGTLSLEIADLRTLIDDEPTFNRFLEDAAQGLDLKLTVLDEINDPIMETTVLRVILSSNPAPIVLNPVGLKDNFAELTLLEDLEYLIQRVQEDGTPINNGLSFNSTKNRDAFIPKTGVESAIANPLNDGADAFKFTFKEFLNDPGYYAIKSVEHDAYLTVATHLQKQGNAGNGNPYKFEEDFLVLGTNRPQFDYPDTNAWNLYKFKIEKERSGVYVIKLKKSEIANDRDLPLNVLGGWAKGTNHSATDTWGLTTATEPYKFWYTGGRDVWSENPTRTTKGRWRIVSSNIDWEFRSAGSEVIQTVMPAPQDNTAYAATEINCGLEGFVTTVGFERSTETTVSAEWAESLSTLSSQTHKLGWEISIGVDPVVGPSYSSTLSGEHSMTTENSRTNTTTTGQTTTESVTFVNSKTITVPKESVSYIDASYQTYDDIDVRFAQRIQLRGFDRTAARYLTGEEILSQLQTTQFDGVVTAVVEDMVELNILGTAVVSNLINGQTTIVELPWADECAIERMERKPDNEPQATE